MKNIEFIPEYFHQVKLDDNHQSVRHKLTPYYPDSPSLYFKNKIEINIPQKIILRRPASEFTPIIPVCGAYVITLRRASKYAHLSAEMLHIRKAGEETWHSGEIIPLEEGVIALPLNYEKLEKERLERIKQAQQYSDDELDEGNASGSAINVDLMEYVDIQLESGVYEIYLSFCGLESNRARVEIIFEHNAEQSSQPRANTPITPTPPANHYSSSEDSRKQAY